MTCRITDLRSKEILNIRDGSKLGNICDLDVDTETGRLVALIIYGKSKAMGLLGREDDIVIPWDSIDVIGDDAILVSLDSRRARARSISAEKNVASHSE